MSAKVKTAPLESDLVSSSREFFFEMVLGALEHRQIKTLPLVQTYLVDLLEHYLVTENLFDEEDGAGRKTRETLAEMFLKAGSAEPRVRNELLKKLGDTSLYVSGFFGDSLQRKLVDVDYYVEMGGAAYSSLAAGIREEAYSQVYREFASRFLEFVEALMYISAQSRMQATNNMLRTYEIYVQTGSELARDQLLEKGIIAPALPFVRGKKEN